jgi:hypothetical protein
MAISRANLLKELLPGLNALFGMEYATYGEEHKEIYEVETSELSLKKRRNSLASTPPQLRTKVRLLRMIMRRKPGLLVTTTRPLH